MTRPVIIGIMGGASASEETLAAAYRLGALVAREGWILLNGGRNTGVMDASARGARDAGGTTLGILPDDHLGRCSIHIDIPVLTGMGSARNCINVLTSRIVVACPGGAGTVSEIALALKYDRPVILLNFDVGGAFERYRLDGCLQSVQTPEEAVAQIKCLLERH